MARIIKGDTVKIISGANKGTTGKVVGVNKDGILIEGVGVMHKHQKPTQLNPRPAHKDIHVAVPAHKVALVIDEKSSKTSRVGYVKDVDGTTVRVARQANNKEIK